MPMITLAIELSSSQGSIAVFEGENRIGEDCWGESRLRNRGLFERIPDLLERASLNIRDIDTYVAGRGPGAFSGIRTGITAVRALAMPRAGNVYAVSSGEAMARRALSDTAHAHVAAIGDARREFLWLGVFGREEAIRREAPWELVRLSELERRLPADTLVVTPDWDRLEEALKDLRGDDVEIAEGCTLPAARDVASLALARLDAGIPSEPMAPIYMHPPIAAPRGAPRSHERARPQ